LKYARLTSKEFRSKYLLGLLEQEFRQLRKC